MNRTFLLLIAVLLIGFSFTSFGNTNLGDPYATEFIIATQDTVPLQERYDDFIHNDSDNPFDLKDPNIIDQKIEYDPETGQYLITEKIGDDYFRMPTYMTFDEYLDWRAKEQEKSYFNRLAGISSKDGGGLSIIDPIAKFDIGSNLIDRLFGGTTVDIRPQGNIDLTFGVDFQRVDNPILTPRQRRQGGFDFDMNIQMNVTGKIGEKLNLATNYNTQATFDFDNQMKLNYDTDAFSEDDIIKKIEAGNVSLPLRGTLIQGAQSLFGIKTELQFGRLWLTSIASQQKSEREEIQIQGGSQLQEFEVKADEYDENRHFFLSHYNRDVFEGSLENMPQIQSLFKIEQIEVWLTNDRNTVNDVRDIVALADLGEPSRLTNSNVIAPSSPKYKDITGSNGLPANDANNLYQNIISNPQARKIDNAVSTLQSSAFQLEQAKDFEKVTARRLRSSEYTFHPELGFLSVNVNVRPDQILAVAYQYSYNGRTFKVGELSNDELRVDTDSSFNVLFVRMLKSTTPRVDLPAWDLMMKNIYNIGAYQVNREDFKLDIFYEDPGGGEKRFLPATQLAGTPLLRVFNLDNLNTQGDPQPDGVFDYVPGVTINPRNGRIMFPVLEPFGSSLEKRIDDPLLSRKYVYQQLYDSTVTRAREYPEYNRFSVRGSFKSSISSEISLGAFNIPPGSVRVSAGGQILVEGTDYEVDYNIGRVKILNDAFLNSGVPIKVSFEDKSLFGFQTKTLVGTRAEYRFNENFILGGTYMHLFERPYTQKVNIGDDPINNRIYGLDINYSNEAPWLTKIVDAIPLIQTKEASSLAFTAEMAALKPGHAKAINEPGDDEKKGTTYLDDFEGSASSFDLRTPINAWVMASVPQNDSRNNNPLFPESVLIDSLPYGANRARLSWYRIDQGVRNNKDREDPYTSLVPQEEVFPNLELTPDQLPNIQTFDMTYYPNERGPYNFDVPGGYPGFTEGLNTSTGELLAPETRWGGVMRSLNTNDFVAANIEALEFWMLSPFQDHDDPDIPAADLNELEGDLYINLGNISEDILRDSRKFFENGLPGPDNPRRTNTSSWSVIPLTPQITNSFDNDPDTRKAQDVGLDGLNNEGEQEHFELYLDKVGAANPNLRDSFSIDPSNDDYIYYRDDNIWSDNDGVFDRYFRHNDPQGNSPANQGQRQVAANTNIPDSEDLNRDNTLNETESYFQYKIPLRANGRELDENSNPYITDKIEDGKTGRIWYKIKIPLDDPLRKSIGGIQDLTSIRFIRLYMHGFEKRVTLRFARLELVRNQWRRYSQSLKDSDVAIDNDETDNTIFDVNAVNIEENSTREPFNYTLPEGIQREQSLGVFNALQNEQSLSMEVCNLKDGDARAVYKIINYDVRTYERLKMFVHAEASQEQDIDPGDLSLFIRLGSDFKNNYYEYEVPLVMSDPDAIQSAPVEEYTRAVWLTDNEFNFPLELLREAKKQRNNIGWPINKEYAEVVDPDKPNNRIRIKGNPNLGLVKGVMIGIRNSLTNNGDDYCAEVWVNELRLSGLDEAGGVAGIARLDLQLADFGGLTIAGNYSSIGFGALDQKLAQRSREEIVQYDLAANFELGKFFPEKTGIRIPFYAQYSNTKSTPQYDPYDLDIILKDKIQETSDLAKRDSIKRLAQDVTTIKSYNFTNVRKDRTNSSKTPMPWDIENFSATYAYSQTEKRDPIIESDKIDNYRGALDYSYSRKGGYLEPFKKLSKSDYLKLITDFNVNPLPNSFSFNTSLDRQFAKTKYRFAGDDPQFNTFYNKRFSWERNYDLQWDLTRSLKLSFNAANFAVIDEPDEFDLETGQVLTKAARRDAIMEGIKSFGRTKDYSHNLNVSYTLPFKQIPLLDWVTVRAQYNADYSWNAASLNTDSLGNVIQNGQTRQINGDFSFEKLYDKSSYLKKISRGSKPSRGSSSNRNSRSSRTPSKDKKDDGKKDDKKEKKDRELSQIEKALIRPLLLLRKGRVTYSETFGTTIPGFTPQSRLLGMNQNFDAPGWGFIAGLQPNIRTLKDTDVGTKNDWLQTTANDGWITSNVFLNQQVLQNYSQKFDAKLTLEPFQDFKIDIETSKQFSENHSEYFKDTTDLATRKLASYSPTYTHAVLRDVGSMTISYFSLNTLFRDSKDEITDIFKTFMNNRAVVSSRIGQGIHEDENEANAGYTEGYGRTQQDVLIPAFLAAYADKDINTVDLDKDYARNILFKFLPKINWRVSYNGLSKLPIFEDLFASFSLSHGYRSTLTVNSFQSDLDFNRSDPLLTNPNKGDYYSRFEIPEVIISEQFSPLLAIDMRLKNDMSFNIDIKKARTLAMSSVSNQLSETQSKEYVIGFGYRMKNVVLPFITPGSRKKGKKSRDDAPQDPNQPSGRSGGRQQLEGNDLDIKFDFSLRDDATYLHIFDEELLEATRGTKTIRISPSADYQLNKRLRLRFFIDYSKTIPKTSASFPITNTQGGITVTFSLN